MIYNSFQMFNIGPKHCLVYVGSKFNFFFKCLKIFYPSVFNVCGWLLLQSACVHHTFCTPYVWGLITNNLMFSQESDITYFDFSYQFITVCFQKSAVFRFLNFDFWSTFTLPVCITHFAHITCGVWLQLIWRAPRSRI